MRLSGAVRVRVRVRVLYRDACCKESLAASLPPPPPQRFLHLGKPRNRDETEGGSWLRGWSMPEGRGELLSRLVDTTHLSEARSSLICEAATTR